MRGIIFIFLLMLIGATKLEAQITQEQIEFQKFGGVIDLIDNFYMDSAKTSDLIENAIVDVLEHLDPHSVYIPKKEVEATNEPLIGNFDGVGIQFNLLNDTVVVANVIPGGPSEKVGVVAGDKIIRVNDTLISGVKIANSGVMSKLRGLKGTKVVVSILRRGEKKIIGIYDYEG